MEGEGRRSESFMVIIGPSKASYLSGNVTGAKDILRGGAAGSSLGS